MRILVTGASGYIGGDVARALRAAGHDVIALARSDQSAGALEAGGFAVERGDLTDVGSIQAVLRQTEAVVHVAVGIGAGRVSELDASVVDAVIDALAGSGQPLILTSGLGVYAEIGLPFADEDTPLDGASAAQVPRIQLEERVLAAAARGIRTIVLRPAHVYGRGSAGILIRAMMSYARRLGHAAYIDDGMSPIAVVHIEDLAAAYLAALDSAPAGSLYNLIGSTLLMREVASAVSHGVGADGRTASFSILEAASEWGTFAPLFANVPFVSSVRAALQLGWTPRAASLAYELIHGSLRQNIQESTE